MSEFRVGIFEYPKCKSKFRLKVESTTKPLKTDIKDLLAKIEEVREGLTQTLRTLQEIIDAGKGAVEFDGEN